MAHAHPLDRFFAQATVTAQDAAGASALGTAGFVADPSTAWTKGQFISVEDPSGSNAPAFKFYWDGAAWQPGAAPDPNDRSSAVLAGVAQSVTTYAGLQADPTVGDAAKSGAGDAAFTTGQYVLVGGRRYFWDGTNWQSGTAS